MRAFEAFLPISQMATGRQWQSLWGHVNEPRCQGLKEENRKRPPVSPSAGGTASKAPRPGPSQYDVVCKMHNLATRVRMKS